MALHESGEKMLLSHYLMLPVHDSQRIQIAGRSAVMNDIPDGETWAGMPAKEARIAMKEQAVIRRLPDWSKRPKELLDDR